MSLATEAGDEVVLTHWIRAQNILLKRRFRQLIAACAALGLGPMVMFNVFEDRGNRLEAVEVAVEALQEAPDDHRQTEYDERLKTIGREIAELEETLQALKSASAEAAVDLEP